MRLQPLANELEGLSAHVVGCERCREQLAMVRVGHADRGPGYCQEGGRLFGRSLRALAGHCLAALAATVQI